MIPSGLLPRLMFDIRVRFMGQRRRLRSRVRVRINIVIFALIALDLFLRIPFWFASSVFQLFCFDREPVVEIFCYCYIEYLFVLFSQKHYYFYWQYRCNPKLVELELNEGDIYSLCERERGRGRMIGRSAMGTGA